MISDLGLLVLRVGMSGLLLFVSGLPKVLHLSEYRAAHPEMALLTVGLLLLAEGLAPALILVGFASRIFAALLVIYFAFATVQVVPSTGGDAYYLVSFLSLTLLGPGRLSLDSLFGWFKRK